MITKINKIRFSAYKRFAGDEEIELRPVTILVGKNSSGKSSIARLLPMLRNSLLPSAANIIEYTNDDVSLGVSFRNLAHNGNVVDLHFGLSFSNDLNIDVDLISNIGQDTIVKTYTLRYQQIRRTLKLALPGDGYICEETGKRYQTSFNGFIHKELFNDLGIDPLLSHFIDYIGPLRVQPQRTIYGAFASNLTYVGSLGKNAYEMFASDSDLQQKVSNWFAQSFNNCEVIAKPGIDPGSYQILLHKPDQEEYYVNIVDEGMGMEQVFPIVVRCLKKIDNSIIVFEQPELHLHPAAHASLAKLFAKTAKENNHSYLIETHSENILLGLRDAVVDKSLDFSSKDVIIYFVDENADGAYLRPIMIEPDGSLSDWPKGVFNESFTLLQQIIEKSTKNDL